jgi:hypothetical protein
VFTRRFASSVVAIAAVGLLGTTGCSGQAAAIRVGDLHMSQSEFKDRLEETETVMSEAVSQGLLPQEQAGDPSGQMRGSYNHEFVARSVQNEISVLLMRQLMKDKGIELPAQGVASTRQQLDQDPVYGKLAAEGKLPESRLTELAEESLLLPTLQQEICPDYVSVQGEPCPDLISAIEKRQTRTDIAISSKFGTWDDKAFTVVPPEGPLVDSDQPDPDDMMLDPGLLPE